MLSKHDSIQRDQLEMITLDQLVPPNHLVRKMEAAINLKKMANLDMARSKNGLTCGLVEPQSLNFRRKFKGNFKRGSEFFNSEPLLSTN